ncbi:MAG: endolytic transglycosylase MltG [Bacteroidia bacterium]|nr:endolytic transglycosylase MltG [Bacteroidia bacterium]
MIKKVILILIISILAYFGYRAYQSLFKSNVELNGKKYTYIYIKTGATFNDVLDELFSQSIIKDEESFRWTAKGMNLAENINPGKYRIDGTMSNRSIIKMIINSKQEKVKLYFNSQIRTKEQFIKYIDDKLELNESELEDYCSNNKLLSAKYNLNSDNLMALIIPETYEVNWTITLSDLFKLIETSYNQQWTETRKAIVKKMGYSVPQVVTLASIVQCESGIKTEQQKIAGVYINRLNKNMRLQADPTIVFANGNFEVQRVLAEDKEIDSPYNTYKYKGLPPGPICLVKPSTIDAVLNYKKHNYIYFCANSDFSGTSLFTTDFKTHLKNAQAYQDALNKKGINR